MVQGRLKRESNPIPEERPGFLPQHEGDTQGDFITTGERNPLPTKDKSTEDRLQEIENKLDSVIENGAFKSQLTGRKVEEVIPRALRNEHDTNNRIYVPGYAKGAILKLEVLGITGNFSSGEGVSLAVYGRQSSNESLTEIITKKGDRSESSLIFIYPDQLNPTIFSTRIIKTEQSVLLNRYRVDILIDGSFDEGEGVDCRVIVEWLVN